MELKFETEKAKVQALEENIVTMELQETRLKKEIDKIIEINRELEGEKKEMGRALAILRDQVKIFCLIGIFFCLSTLKNNRYAFSLPPPRSSLAFIHSI